MSSLILDCYRLAKFYNSHPDEWLSKPLSEIAQHRLWTARLVRVMSVPRLDED